MDVKKVKTKKKAKLLQFFPAGTLFLLQDQWESDFHERIQLDPSSRLAWTSKEWQTSWKVDDNLCLYQVTRDYIYDLLYSAKEANMNMLRVSI